MTFKESILIILLTAYSFCLPENNPPFGASLLPLDAHRTNLDLSPMPFIKRKDGLLYKGDELFRFVSYNVPGLLLLEDRFTDKWDGLPICKKPSTKTGGETEVQDGQECRVPSSDKLPPNTPEWVPPLPWEQEDAIKTIAIAQGSVIRTYTLGFGERYHVKPDLTFYEPAWVAMDYALALAAKYRIYLIIPILNNHNPGAKDLMYGSYAHLCKWRNIPVEQFYTNNALLEDVKTIISFMLNRINTITGVRYGDDPTVLAWQLGNELGGWKDPGPPPKWTLEIARHVKSLAPKTLVMDGVMGGLISSKRFVPPIINSSDIDILSNHYYHGDSDLERLKSDTKVVTDAGKVFVVGEFGLQKFELIKGIIDAIVENPKVSGCLIWSLRYHSRDGGFYVHREEKGQLSYHAPGFVQTIGFSPEEKDLVPYMRESAVRAMGLTELPHLPTPDPPSAVEGSVTPNSLRWRGSTWSKSYRIYRISGPDTQQYLGEVSDSRLSGQTLFVDEEAVPGVNYSYKVFAVSLDGNLISSGLDIENISL